MSSELERQANPPAHCHATRVPRQAEVSLQQVIIEAAECGATIQEIAAYLDTEIKWLKKHHGRTILQAWARRTIRLRRAQTRLALRGDRAMLNRLVGEDESMT